MYMSEIEGILEMVRVNAPRLMAAGGGALPKEQNPSCVYRKPRTSPEQVEAVVKMAKGGSYTANEIAKAVGLKRSVVQHVTHYRGIKLKDERVGARTT
jgi:hypothetical protein